MAGNRIVRRYDSNNGRQIWQDEDKSDPAKGYSMMVMTLRSLVDASSSSTSSTGYITDARRQPAITKSLPMIMAESRAALANHNVHEDCPA